MKLLITFSALSLLTLLSTHLKNDRIGWKGGFSYWCFLPSGMCHPDVFIGHGSLCWWVRKQAEIVGGFFICFFFGFFFVCFGGFLIHFCLFWMSYCWSLHLLSSTFKHGYTHIQQRRISQLTEKSHSHISCLLPIFLWAFFRKDLPFRSFIF